MSSQNAVVARALALLLLILAACSDAAPTAVYPADTPSDLVELADEVFAEFVAAFPAQRACIGTVEIHGAWELDDRALYRPSSRVVEVRIPATAPHLTSSLVHELGHHLEFACSSQEGVRPDFLAAVGLAEWEGASYEDDPTELWAEAVVRHVTGRPDTRRILSVPAGAVEVVATWAGG